MKRKFECISGKLQKQQLFYPNEKVYFNRNATRGGRLQFQGIVKKLDIIRNEHTNENEYIYTINVEGADIINVDESDIKRK